MLTDNLLACVGKRVNVTLGHQATETLHGVELLAVGAGFIELAAGGRGAKRIPLAQVRAIETAA